jgi:putative phage-type endonuclease
MITETILKERKKGIGGSDVAAILGVSRYKTAVDVFLEKHAQPEEIIPVENEAIHWGNCLEKVIAEEYQRRSNCVLEEPTEMFRDKVHPFLLANPDRVIVGKGERGNGILECKTCSAYKASEWGEEGSDQIPTEYLLQIAHYRYILDVDFVDLAVLIGGNHFGVYTYLKNENLENKMREKLCVFWNDNVLKNIPPEPTTRRDVESLFEKSCDDKFIEADENIENTLKEIYELKNSVSILEEDIKKKQHDVCSKMKDASVIINKNGEKICTWRTVNSKRFDTSFLKKNEPEIYSKYLKESSSRVFRINSAYSFGG